MIGFTFHIFNPRVTASGAQIIRISLVGIGFSLKRDVAVGIAAHGQAHQPLQQISHIEEYKQHFTLLGSVNALVVQQFMIQIHAMVHKQHTQQIDGAEALERQYRCPYYLHRRKGTTFS